MSDRIANEIIRLAKKKPEYRSRLLGFLKKTAFSTTPENLANLILHNSLPVLHFRGATENLEPTAGLVKLTNEFSRDLKQIIYQYWFKNGEEVKTPRPPQGMFSEQGILNLFMICLHPSPIRWLRDNEPTWLRSLFSTPEGLENFVRSLKNNRNIRGYVTDIGGGSLVKSIMQSAYNAGIR